MKIWSNNFFSQQALPNFYVKKVDKELTASYKAISKTNNIGFPRRNKEELLKSLTKDLDNQSDRKKGLEDKVKAILFGVTISISAMTFSLNSHSYAMNSVIGIIAFSLLIVSIYYFVTSAILAVKILIPTGFHMIQTDTSFEPKQSKIIVKLKDSDEYLKSLIRYKELNDNINLRISNSTYVALKLFRNGIIIFAFYFIAAQFQKGIETKNIAKTVQVDRNVVVEKGLSIKENPPTPLKKESVSKVKTDSAKLK